jgi:hypothetical protein
VIITYNNFVFQNVADNCHSLPAKCLLCANFITREMKEREYLKSRKRGKINSGEPILQVVW